VTTAFQSSAEAAADVTHSIGVIADISGLALTADDRDFLSQPEVAGIILFSRNYESPQQLQQLTAELQRLRPDLLISVDQEGGRVQRFRDGFTRLPPMLMLEQQLKDDPQAACSLASELGWLMATELLAHGVHLSFAPVLDIERDCSTVIGDRAFGHSAENVLTLATAFVDGMAEAGMAAVGKHFPGHGAVVADSHLELPIDERSKTELDYDIQPFAALIARQSLAGVMPAHVIYPAVDGDNTAGFSSRWLQHVLRQQLGFGGVIFSDDLSMAGAAAAGNYRARSARAIAAGCNALLACNNRDAAVEVVLAVKRAMADNAQLTHLDLSPLIPTAEYMGSALGSESVKRRDGIREQLALWM